MILTNLQNTWRIESLHPRFKELFDYVKSHDMLHTPLGRIVIDEDVLFINNVALNGMNKEDQVLEMHQQYIDVHILLKGSETIGWKAFENIKEITKPYKEDQDCAIAGDAPTAFVKMRPGDIVVVFPEDPHAPAIGRGAIRKLIAKVRI